MSDWQDDLTRYKHPGNIAPMTLQGMAGYINSRHPGAIQQYTKMELEPEDKAITEEFGEFWAEIYRQGALPENQGKELRIAGDRLLWVEPDKYEVQGRALLDRIISRLPSPDEEFS